MRDIDRRSLISGLATAGALPAIARAQGLRKARMVLNTAFSGPQAWLLMAQDKGYLADTGLDIAFTTGEGAFTAAPRMVAQGFDFGYGDVNSLMEVVARGQGDAPVGVFMMFNASPSTIAVAANGPIRTPADLAGRTISGHPTDVALRTFGAFCETARLDPATVTVKTFDGTMRQQAEAMLAGAFDGIFGYVSTITAALASAGLDASKTLRFIDYATYCPDLYGSCLMASRQMIREEPRAVAALARGLNRGLADVLADKDAAIEAVVRRDPLVRRDVDKLRLQTTLDVEMSHDEGRRLGIGAVDEARLARSIALVARTNHLPRTPATDEIFTPAFLPPASERVTTLARAAILVPGAGRGQQNPVKLLLNTSFSGPVSFLLLAEDRGYLREADLAVAFSPGDGAAAIVPKVRGPAFDAGYGDITALIQRIAAGPENEGPVAIWTTFNSVPFTIAVPAAGPVHTPRDFMGRAISGDAHDAALVTFDMFARATGIDPARVTIVPTDKPMGNQVADMLKGNGIDGVFGFVNTIIASVAPLGIDGRRELRFLTYAEHLPDMYGNGLFVTRELYADKAACAGLVRAFNRALTDAVAHPDLAMDALTQRNAAINRDVNRTRLVGTFGSEMAHPEGARIGIGDMDDARLSRLIDLVVEAKRLPRKPGVREVFDRSFLPPDAERIRTLARS